MQVDVQVEMPSGSSSRLHQLPRSRHSSANQSREIKGKKIERRQSTTVSSTSDTVLHSPPQIIRPTIPCTAILLPRSADESQSPPSSPLSPFPIEIGASFIPLNVSTSPVIASPNYQTSQSSTPSPQEESRNPTPLFSPHADLHFAFPPNQQGDSIIHWHIVKMIVIQVQLYSTGSSTVSKSTREVVDQIPLPSSIRVDKIPVPSQPAHRRDSKVPSSDIKCILKLI